MKKMRILMTSMQREISSRLTSWTKKNTSSLKPETRTSLTFLNAGKYFYELNFKNIGGLVMPLIIQINYTDSNLRNHQNTC